MTGNNSYLLGHELQKRVDSFVAEYTDLGLERLDGEEAEYIRLAESIQSLPFLVAKKLVVLRAPCANKQFVENATQLLAGANETTDVIIVEPKLDKRSAYYKFLKKQPNYKEYNELDAVGLAHYVCQAVEDRGGDISSQDASYLVARVGTNQQRADSELQKLLSYESHVSRANIDLLTDASLQSTVFDLLESCFGGEATKVASLYAEQRAQKVEPQAILAMIIWQLHNIALCKSALLVKESPGGGVSPYVLQKSMAIARKLSMKAIIDLSARVRSLDLLLKTQAVDANTAIQNLLLHIAFAT